MVKLRERYQDIYWYFWNISLIRSQHPTLKLHIPFAGVHCGKRTHCAVQMRAGKAASPEGRYEIEGPGKSVEKPTDGEGSRANRIFNQPSRWWWKNGEKQGKTARHAFSYESVRCCDYMRCPVTPLTLCVFLYAFCMCRFFIYTKVAIEGCIEVAWCVCVLLEIDTFVGSLSGVREFIMYHKRVIWVIWI